ncbi:adenosylhomocysteinase [Patescibacteria group bacterium]|nr:adenosylhomocysteinase [Patescibacteria group bacterium]MBU1673224.1 adenosylhomocysteinase [Patescibacteria group bacterium]MBU1964018.1 adenosylhomocysteinase [Patescibacteria group bacterium]
MKSDVKNIKLAPQGKKRIEWAESQMDVLRTIKTRFKRTKPLKNISIAACLHVTAETANLMRTLKEGGANAVLCASNPLSTQDDVAASLVNDYKIPVFAINNEDRKTYYKHLNAVLDTKPEITMDDGADLVALLHSKRKNLAENIWGSTEETTTGVVRLESMEKAGKLIFPVIAVNESKTKHFFDNRYGTGQSTVDGIVRATNVLLAGKTIVVVGYGWCGRGFATKARGMGAHVIVTEVDAIKSIEAVLDGFQVMPMMDAAPLGDFFVTLTGDLNVVDGPHMKKMKDGAIVCNSGHFDNEINMKWLRKNSIKKREVRDFVMEYTMPGNKHIRVLAEGRLINLASAEGHPPSVMDMSFANQALAAEYVKKNHKKMENKVYVLPEKLDNMIAEIKLDSMGIKIDTLTPEQVEYLASWQLGT